MHRIFSTTGEYTRRVWPLCLCFDYHVVTKKRVHVRIFLSSVVHKCRHISGKTYIAQVQTSNGRVPLNGTQKRSDQSGWISCCKKVIDPTISLYLGEGWPALQGHAAVNSNLLLASISPSEFKQISVPNGFCSRAWARSASDVSSRRRMMMYVLAGLFSRSSSTTDMMTIPCTILSALSSYYSRAASLAPGCSCCSSILDLQNPPPIYSRRIMEKLRSDVREEDILLVGRNVVGVFEKRILVARSRASRLRLLRIDHELGRGGRKKTSSDVCLLSC